MLGWIIPVAQYVLCIATAMLLVSAAFMVLDATVKSKRAVSHMMDEAREHADELLERYNKARQNDKGGK
jgi:ABC-type siderophore export system fused ATPase/permease subunit